ncbi:MAG: alpha/beta hydrolase [Thermoclostridium sp.]|nr:alpha/beta hydrolase [Thermoclostridium sp.]
MRKVILKLLLLVGLFVVVFLIVGTVNQAIKKKDYNINYSEGQLYDVGGSKLYAQLGGNPSGTTIVFEPGLGDGSYSWCTYAPLLQEDYQTLIYDKGGVGRSEPSSYTDSLDGEANELKALLESAGIQTPVILVGHSRGGAIARRFAQLYPNSMKGIVLIDTTNEVMFEDSISRAFYKLDSILYGLLGFANNFGVPRLLHDMGSPILEREIDSQILAAKGTEYFEEYNELCFRNSYLQTVSRQTATVAQILDLVEAGPAAQEVPAYIVYDVPLDEDQADTEAMVANCIQRIQRQFPHSESKIVYDAGHYIHVTMPEVITEGIEWVLSQ